MRKRFGQTFQAYLNEHQTLYVFTIVLFAMGVVFGAVLVNSLGLSQKEELLRFLEYFFSNMNRGGLADPQLHFLQSFAFYLKTVGIMWILGLSIIGLPMILLLLFLKGIVVGFTVGFLVSQMQWQGVMYALAGVLPQNMLVVPALILIGVGGISFSLRLIKTRLLSKRDQIMPHFLSYSVLVLVMFSVLTIAALFETFVSPALIRYATN
ncbi:stage II sporulation protein M [Brevibacillus fluminis]|uniref:stage II sporulation protein M n=1 Tax=Brevibacillus fluminis TaxID=511487 RepID=UPI003F8B8AC7